jgi:16S rRNA (adenine1518-N6/adenine1519-N6)-dimethyltransferase
VAEPAGLPPLREVIRRHGLGARKSLGQNFLLDLNLTRRIARAAAPLDACTVIEVGPGPGGLTRALLAEGASRVVVIEKDERFRPALDEIAASHPGRLEIVAGDALALDAAALAPAPRKIVANLPYNVATPLLIGWLRDGAAFESLTLMFQKEVALRLVAAPRTAEYGRLSVIAQLLAEPRLMFDVPPSAFVPPPKVVSTVVRLVPRPPFEAIGALERVTAAAFGQRRKMLRGSLRSLGVDVERLLAATGLAPTARAEEIPVAGYAALARALAAG